MAGVVTASEVDRAGSGPTLAARAQAVMPGGVNSVNRVMPWPFVVREASGATVTDVDGRTYIDYHAAFGPLILGHRHPTVDAAVHEATSRVDLIGAGVTDLEIELAELIVKHVPAAQQVVLTNSGSEATYAALRLARAATGRNRIIKFQGSYHGWHDAVLMNVISGADRIGHKDPLSEGMSDALIEDTIVLPWNDATAVRQALADHGHEVAAILVEVIPHNIGCVPPEPGYLAELRDLADSAGAVLIFDEVITGFRHDIGGYQRIAGVTPDLATFAKAMGNGYPIAALAGRTELMQRFRPGGGVVFAGTYNGHTVGVSAAIATIELLEQGDIHAHTADLAERAATGLETIAAEAGIPMTVARFGSVFVPYFMEGPIRRYEDLLANDDARDVWFRRTMAERGFLMFPTALKRNHISAAHTTEDVDRTLEAARAVLADLPSDPS